MRTKILLSIAILSFFCFSAKAQIDSGRIFLGGSVNYNIFKSTSSNPAEYSSNQNENFGTNIQIGKFIKKNTAVGIIVSYNNSNSHNPVNADSNYNKINEFSAGVFYRKYKKLLKNFYFFGELDATYNHSNYNTASTFSSPPYSNYSYNISKSPSNGFGVSFIPGISYSLCKKLYMELSMPNLIAVSYAHSTTDNTGGPPSDITHLKGNTFSIGGNLYSYPLSNFGIGFKLLL
jgi:hypothetical protein